MCWTDAPPPAPLELTATAPGSNVLLEWRNSPSVPAGSTVKVARGAGACPTSLETGTVVGLPGQPTPTVIAGLHLDA